jgi:hypothetical protein
MAVERISRALETLRRRFAQDRKTKVLNRTFQLVVIACLVTGMSSVAKDPFVGRWEVNPAKSKPTDRMKIEVAGANRYTVTFIPDATETVVANGSDQPGMRGTTLSIAIRGPNNWRVIRKKAAVRCSRRIGCFPPTAIL